MDFPRHSVIHQYTGFLLRRAAAASFGGFTALTAEHGLHPMHFGMLTILAAEGPIAQNELGRRIGIDPSTMVARMDALEREGMVERHRREEDRRAYEISLTPKGTRTLETLTKEANAYADRIFAPLTKDERRQLHDLLEKVVEGLDEHAESG